MFILKVIAALFGFHELTLNLHMLEKARLLVDNKFFLEKFQYCIRNKR